jgi:hypothetical protein
MECGVWVDSDPGDQIIKSPASSNNVPFLPGYVVGSRERICRGLCSSRAISKRFQKEVCVELLRVEKENWIEGGGEGTAGWWWWSRARRQAAYQARLRSRFREGFSGGHACPSNRNAGRVYDMAICLDALSASIPALPNRCFR